MISVSMEMGLLSVKMAANSQEPSTVPEVTVIAFHRFLQSSGNKNTKATCGLHMATASSRPARVSLSSSTHMERITQQHTMPLWLPNSTALAHMLGANTSSDASTAMYLSCT